MLNMAEGLDRLGALATSPIMAKLGAAFAEAGFELAVVGGPVRDALLGRRTNDLDLTTNARPDDILRVVAPLATATWDIGRAFGTIGAKIAGPASPAGTAESARPLPASLSRPAEPRGAGTQVEITTYRADSYDHVTRKPTVAFGDSLEADLSRRDFTIGAMALRLPVPALIDPTGGVEDLVAGILRTPGDPDVSFGDDPLRMLRAARFAGQLGFDVAPDTLEAMSRLRESIRIVSAERVQAELVKLLASDDPVRGIRILVDTGLMGEILPEIPALRLEIDEHHHHKDVYEHSLTVLQQAIDLEHERHPESAPDITLRLAALLHDIGKPATRKLEPGGGVSFHHHDLKGARMARKRLKELRFDSDTIDAISQLVEQHLRFFGYAEGAWTDSAVRRYVRDAGDQLERLHMLTRADVTTRNAKKATRLRRAYDDLERRIGELAAQEELAAIRPELDGNRIQQILGIGPGREVGEAYRFLMDLRLDEGMIGEDAAEQRLRDWWATRG